MSPTPKPALPETGRVVTIPEYGGPEVLTVVERPLPVPGAGEVLIRVKAAGVNRPDCLQRAGQYPPPPDAVDIPGLEVAGMVVAVGDGVALPAIGDEVCALVNGGGYADYCVAPAGQCLPLPAGMPAAEAAALPETFFTVWTNLFERGALKAGESVLIHGGASGIGTTAVQLARAFGAEVFATAGSDSKVAAVTALGATTFNYRTTPFHDAVKAATDGRGVDVILDIVGARNLADNVSLLADDGRLVVIGLMGGAKAELNLARVMMRRLTVTGSTLRARSRVDKAAIAEALKREVWPKLASGEVEPVIQEWLPLTEVSRAHRLLEGNATCGKLVLLT